MSTKEKIIELLKERDEMRPVDMLGELDISQQMLHRHLKALLESGLINKIGKSPHIFYTLATTGVIDINTEYFTKNVDGAILNLIKENFLHITPTGKRLEGAEAFIDWCKRRGVNSIKMAKKYKDVIERYSSIRSGGLLDATDKMKKTFKNLDGGLCVSKVFYVDFYALEIFGKTKLGQTLLYAKQSQDATTIRDIAHNIKPKIERLIKNSKIEAVVYVPPTVKRKVQFMKVLEQKLAISLPKVTVVKVLGDVVVPQKTLKTLSDRVENANASFIIKDSSTKYNTILIIDDAVGSGASINQIACKLKATGVAKRVIGVAITGSLNNFDVISEV